MGSGNIAVHYALRLVKTESGTGYFSCFPEEDSDFDTWLRYARAHPNDEFMRKHLLRLINGWGRGALKQAIQAAVSSDLFLLALFFDACLLNRDFDPLQRLFDPAVAKRLVDSPCGQGKPRSLDPTFSNEYRRAPGTSGTGRRKPDITAYGSVDLKGRESERDLKGGVRSNAGRLVQAEFLGSRCR